MELIAARLACTACDREWEIELPAFRCPSCGGAEVQVVSGDELEVESIEVEEEPACTA
jgi:hydrogenase nickel incorporation protein HypA/HybF